MEIGELQRRIRQGRGADPAQLVIRGIEVLDIITGETTVTDIAITDDVISGVYADYEGVEVIDGHGLTAVPGFIDTHCHIESSLLTPFEFDRCVLPLGVTTSICDPHEIANVVGLDGIRYFLECAQELVMDLRVQLSSCVPATVFETSGAELLAHDLLELASHSCVIGLAEFMNYPGVLGEDPAAMAKLLAFAGGHIDGHCPLLLGRDLNGYIAAGIHTEHEATSEAEAREKLKKGMTVLIREGSVSKDLDALMPLIDADTCSFLAFCTDDRNPLDMAETGHLDGMIRRAIAAGKEAHHVYRIASWSAAKAFGLNDRGMIAPGKRADIALLSDVETCKVEQVIAGGRLVTPERFEARKQVAPRHLTTMKRAPVQADQFRNEVVGQIRAIGVVPGLIITDDLEVTLPDDRVNDVAVIARHGVNENIGLGHVVGFDLTRGAIASSVGHDSHNITVVGASTQAMARAVNAVIAMSGGFAVADDEDVLAKLALPVAGLMSLETFESVHDALLPLRDAARAIGCTLPEPFLQVAFLPLPVIPHLKITDKGLFDVNRFELVGQ